MVALDDEQGGLELGHVMQGVVDRQVGTGAFLHLGLGVGDDVWRDDELKKEGVQQRVLFAQHVAHARQHGGADVREG